MQFALYQVDENGFINLNGIAEPGQNFTVSRNDNSGVIRLVPIEVHTTKVAAKTPTDPEDAYLPGV